MSTDSHYKKRHPLTLVFGLLVIAFCVLFCSAIIYKIFDPAFAGIGAVITVMFAYFPAFVALGMVRFLSHANAKEAWAFLPCFLSAIVLLISGVTVGLLEYTFFPHEAEYRSLRFAGVDMSAYFAIMAYPTFLVFCVIGFLRLPRIIMRFAYSIGQTPQPPPQSPQRTLTQFVRQNWKKDIAVTVLFYLALTTSAFTMLALDPPLPKCEEHLTYKNFPFKKGFPAEGSDFAYWRNSESFQCEFTISEEDFLRWVSTAYTDWEIKTIPADNPFLLLRYYRDREESVEVTDGLFVGRNSDENRYIFEGVVFDRKTNRAYYDYESD